jgi:hypothetical protein
MGFWVRKETFQGERGRAKHAWSSFYRVRGSDFFSPSDLLEFSRRAYWSQIFYTLLAWFGLQIFLTLATVTSSFIFDN